MLEVLLAARNGERFLAAQLDSLLAQTEAGWTLLISDDCSTDRTPEIARDYAARFPEKIRFARRERPSGGAAAHFLELLAGCGADYAMACDQDDVWLPEKISRALERMRAMETETPGLPLLVHTDLRVADGALRERGSFWALQRLDPSRDGLQNLLAQNVVTGCTMLLNRPLLGLLRPPPEGAVMHDWWCALTAAAFGRIGALPRADILYRQHGGNTVGAKAAGSPGYLLSRLRDRAGARGALLGSCAQARAFLLRYHDLLDEGQRALLDAYAGLPALPGPARAAALARHGFWKHGLARKLGQLLFF